MKFILAVLVLASCAPGDGSYLASGPQVSIPTVVLSCQTSRCKTNSPNPVISTIISTASCPSALYGGIVSNGTTSIGCNASTGCFGSVPSWTTGTNSGTNTSGSTSTIASSTYNICSCINYQNTAIPWISCDTTGDLSNVSISSVTGVQTITNWTDH